MGVKNHAMRSEWPPRVRLPGNCSFAATFRLGLDASLAFFLGYCHRFLEGRVVPGRHRSPSPKGTLSEELVTS